MEIEALVTFIFLFTTTFAAPQSSDSHEYGGFELQPQSINLMSHYDSSYFDLESRTNDCSEPNKLTCFNETALSLCTPTGPTIIHCQGLTPKCSPVLNVCVSEKFVKRTTNFTCPAQDGYYPDLTSCRKYYFCAKRKAKEYNCDLTDVYDPKTRSCVRHLGSHCHKFQCLGKQGTFTPYSGDQSIYALCLGHHPIRLFRCEDGLGLNEREQKCTPLCEKEGLIKDRSSCQKYYECTRILTGYKVRGGECSSGAWFDPAFGHCRMLEDENDCPEAAMPEEDGNSMTSPATKTPATTTPATTTPATTTPATTTPAETDHAKPTVLTLS